MTVRLAQPRGRDPCCPARGRRLTFASCTGAWHTVGVEFEHAGLRRLWKQNDASRLNADHAARVNRILDDLAAASRPKQMDLPGYRLHQLRGNRRGSWSVRVSGNLRVTFRFAAGRAVDIDLEDYH